MTWSLSRSWYLVSCATVVAACATNEQTLPTLEGAAVGGSDDTSGGSAAIDPGLGGTTNTGGSAPGPGGATSQSGGGSSTGGISAMGGGASTGGAGPTGGAAATGGAPGSGGGPGPSGGSGSGGNPALGGAAGSGTDPGGAVGSGGDLEAGGSSADGGVPGAGGTTSTGGGGGGAGESNTGGATGEVCAWDEGPSASNGRMTCYWFGQGTSRDETTCPGGFKTYCSYCGAETGERPQGDGEQIWCPINDVVNTVQNISTPHFAAIPPGPLGQGQNCGMCVEVSYRGQTITATVIDACPSCVTDEHIDLSLSAAEALGMTEVVGEVLSGVTWRSVACPVTSDIQVLFNGGYQGQVYFQNVAFPIATASSGERQATINTGFWDFRMEMGGQEVTLTDVMGHTVTATVPTQPGSLGVQFDLTCQ